MTAKRTFVLVSRASPRDAKLDPIEHAAFASLCAMILNLDETLTKQ